MSLGLDTAIRKAKAALAKTKDAKERERLKASLASYSAALEAYKKEKHTIEKHEKEEGEDDEDGGNETDRSDEPEDDEDKDKDEDDEEKSAKSAEEEKKAKSESEEEEASSEEDEKKCAASVLKAARAITGKRSSQAIAGALRALSDKASQVDALAADVREIKRERAVAKKEALISDALRGMLAGKSVGGPRITKADAKWLKSQPMGVVESYLENRKTALVLSGEEDLARPDGTPGAGVSAEAMKSIETAVMAANLGTAAEQDALRQKLITAQREGLAQKANGMPGGRY
jgi:hypothetical protein